MKRILNSEFIRILFAIVVTLGLAEFTVAAPGKDARVTQVIKDVRLLASKAGARPAAVNDSVGEGQAVRTGGDSRAELTFTDQTITRLGANTVFSYGAGAKEFDLASGAVLMCVPKQAGTIKINTAAATAAVTGFTSLTEYHKKWGYKFIVLEGEACIKLKKNPTAPCMTLGPGDMLLLPDGVTRFPDKKHVDIKKVLSSAKLVNGFDNSLPKWALKDILLAAENQQSGPPPGGGYSDPTSNAVDQRNATHTPTPGSTPHSSPPGDLRQDRPRHRNR